MLIMRMRKPLQNFVIDVASLVALVFLISTGFLMRYTLPPGQSHGQTVLGLSRHDWGGLHFWVSMGLLVLIAVHIALHWKWIVTMVKGRVSETSGHRIAASVVAVLALILIILAPFLLPVQQQGRHGGERGRSAAERMDEAPDRSPVSVSRAGGDAAAGAADASCTFPAEG